MIDEDGYLTFEWPYPKDTHVLRVTIHDNQALAYEWISAYVDQLNGMIDEDYYGDNSLLDVEEFIRITVDWYNDSQDSNSWPDYLVKGGAFEGFGMEPMYWDKLAEFLDVELKKEYCNGYFSCSC